MIQTICDGPYRGTTYRGVPGDGNCLFSSLAQVVSEREIGIAINRVVNWVQEDYDSLMVIVEALTNVRYSEDLEFYLRSADPVHQVRCA